MNLIRIARPKWPWRGIRVQVPKPGRSVSSLKFAVTSPFCSHPNHFSMQTSNGPGVDSKKHSVNPTNDARHALDVGAPLTQSQADFLYIVDCQGCRELSQSLKMIHDLALYHSDIPFDKNEKTALFDLKVLWEGLEKMGAKA
jgi:hypothetical protein